MSATSHIVFHLVDDNDIDIAVNSKLLELSGLSNQIKSYNGAKSLLAAIDQHRSDFMAQQNVILLDIMMPHLNGFDCLDQLTELPDDLKKTIHVFMLSSSIDRKDIQRAESYALVQKVLEKPLDIYALQNDLRNAGI
jgi:CheY-like chemotaxis protein